MVNGFGKRLNESFSKYFSKLNESKFEEFENMEKEPMFTFPNGEYLYVNVDKNKDTIYAGGASNAGVFREFEIDYDFDDTLDGNLNRLYDTIIEERPELLDELDEPNDDELELTTDDMNGGQWFESLDEGKSSDERVLNFNRKLAKKIKSELQPGKSKQIAFEDFAGTNNDFIKAAEDAGLTITDKGAYTITVKNPINESLKESVEKFIITKVGDNKYALAKGNPPVINSRKTIEANSPEEAKEILMKYGYSEDELIVESLLNEAVPRDLMNKIKGTINYRELANSEKELNDLQTRIDNATQKINDNQAVIDRLLRRNKNESLKESIKDRSKFKSDIYNALADVCFEYTLKDEAPTMDEIEEALEWFVIHFVDE